MKKLKSDGPTCMSVRPRRPDCTLNYMTQIIARFETFDKKKSKDVVLVDISTDPHWRNSCRDDEFYDIEVLEVKMDKKFDTVRIVFQSYLDRNDASLGYDLWFDDFYHGYGSCKQMECGTFPPPLLKG